MSAPTSHQTPAQLPSGFRATHPYHEDIARILDSHFHKCHNLTEEQRKNAIKDPFERQILLYGHDEYELTGWPCMDTSDAHSNGEHVRDSAFRLSHTLRHRIDRYALHYPHAHHAAEGNPIKDRQDDHRKNFVSDTPLRGRPHAPMVGAHFTRPSGVDHPPLDRLNPDLSSMHTHESMQRLHHYIYYNYICMSTEQLATRAEGAIPSDDCRELNDTKLAASPKYHYPLDRIFRPGMMQKDMKTLKIHIARSLSPFSLGFASGPRLSVKAHEQDSEFWRKRCNKSFANWMLFVGDKCVQEQATRIHERDSQRAELMRAQSNSPDRKTLRIIHDAAFDGVYSLQKTAFAVLVEQDAKSSRAKDKCVYTADIKGYVFAYLHGQCERLRLDERLPADRHGHHKVRSYLAMLNRTFGQCISAYLDEDPAYLRNIWNSQYRSHREIGVWPAHEGRGTMLDVAVVPVPWEDELFEAADRFVPIWLCETPRVDPDGDPFHIMDLCADAWEKRFFFGHTSDNARMNKRAVPEEERKKL